MKDSAPCSTPLSTPEAKIPGEKTRETKIPGEKTPKASTPGTKIPTGRTPLRWNTPIPITLPRCYDGEAEAICALLDAGAQAIHIRKPDATPAQTEALLRQLRDADADLSRLTLHHDPHLALQYGLGGIHMHEEALHAWRERGSIPGESGPAQRSATKATRVSIPAHSWDEAARLAPDCNYILISPLFDSISKPGYHSTIDPAEACLRLRIRRNNLAETHPCPTNSPADALASTPLFSADEHIVALGGIHPGNIASARAAGFDGAAVLGAVWALCTPDTKTPSSAATPPNPVTTTNPTPQSAAPQRIDPEATLRNFRTLTRRWQAAGGTLQFISDGDLATAEAYLQGGGHWVQLRMKDTPPEAIIARGSEMLALCRRYDALLIVNDNPELAHAIGVDGVHLGQGDMHPDQARTLLGDAAIIGCTANTFDQIAQVAQSSADYIGLGPFRYTTTKRNLSPILGAEGYTEIMRRMAAAGIRLPVVAIGGIEIPDVPQVMQTGVSGIALSGAISRAEDISATTAQFAEWIRNHRTVVMP